MNQMNVLDTLLQLFKSYGYWIVFFGVMLENAGLPVPGETILLAAGFIKRSHRFEDLVDTDIARQAVQTI